MCPGISEPTGQFFAAGPRQVIDYWDAVTAAIEQGRLVKVNSATEVEKTVANDVNAIGIADRDLRKVKTATYAIGDAVPVSYLITGQIYKLTAGAAITIGSRVKTGADGKVVAFVAPAVATDIEVSVIGVALQAASGDLDEFLVLIAR